MRTLAAAAAVLVAACSVAVARGEAQAVERATVFFVADGKLAPAARNVPRAGDRLGVALRSLLRGPSAAERRAGISTAVPAGSRLLGASLRNGVATVRFSAAFGRTPSRPAAARFAQVVYTATAVAGVRSVVFVVDGKAVRGLAVPRRRVTRSAYAALLPDILLEQPAAGARVASPLRLRGSARGRLSALLLDGDGDLLATRVLPEPRGRASFDFTLRFPARQGRGRLLLFTVAGADVTQLDVPVLLG